MHLGEQISEPRRDRGYTQKQLAETLNISPTSLSNYENEINLPNPYMFLRISEIFNVSVDFLLGKTNIESEYNVLQTEKIGNIMLSDFNKQLLEFDKEHRKMMCQYLELVTLHYKVNSKRK